ncbi:MAG: serine/threonine-protein kinase [Dehalococcoidia bacterium]
MTSALAPTGAPDPADFEPGALLEGRYRVDRRLALGGSSLVHAATDVRLGRPVALKIALTIEGGPQLEREGALLATLAHPRVVRLLDVVPGNRPVLVLEEGGVCLEQLRRSNGPAPDDLLSRWATDLDDALRYLHGCGVLHLDVTPANVLVGADGHARLIDFGSARAIEDPHQPLTEGTPRFMAPALRRGEPPSMQADLHALNATLACMSGCSAPPEV